MAAAIIATLILRFAYARENQKRGLMDVAAIREKYTLEDLDDMGGKSPLYRYVL